MSSGGKEEEREKRGERDRECWTKGKKRERAREKSGGEKALIGKIHFHL